MNGRIYDPTLGRFLQADPFIQAPTNSQSYNRYSYVLNNPMSYTDPSGYFFKKLGKFIKKYWRTALAIVATVYLGPAASAFFGSTIAGGAVAGFVAGGIATGSLRGALVGAFTGAMFGALHGLDPGALKVAGHGVAGGISSVLNGGKFGHGFLSAGLTQAMGNVKGLFTTAPQGMARIGNAVKAAVIGGTVSKVTGGKFANGAMTGAFSRLLNDDLVSRKVTATLGKAIGAVEAEYSSDKGFDVKFKSSLKAGGVNLEIDSKGQIQLMDSEGVKIGHAIDGSSYGVQGQIDGKVLSFALSVKASQDGYLYYGWKVGASSGLVSGSYGEEHRTKMSEFPLFNNFYQYYNNSIISTRNPNNVCNSSYGKHLSACGG